MGNDIQSLIENWPKNQCFVCGRLNISDQHHIKPVEFGGPEDGLTVPLCPTDHRAIHREATEIFKRNQEGKYVNRKLYPVEEQYNRACLLAKYVLHSMKVFLAKGEAKAEGARNMMQVSFTRAELAAAHDLKRKLGFRSLERMVKHLILDKWKDVSR